MRELFRKISHIVSNWVGTPAAFSIALIVVLGWAILGPVFGFSNTWQLFINTMTTILTFLMVFLIQNTQNRDSKAVHLKLDEIIRAIRGARDQLVDLEDMTDEELEVLENEFKKLRTRAVQKYDSAKRRQKIKKDNKDLVSKEESNIAS